MTSLLPHLHLATTKRLVNGLSLVPILVLVLAAEGLAQAAPQPTPSAAGPCPAVVRYDYDVSSIPDADRIRWQLWRGAPGQPFEAATRVDDGEESGTTGSVQKNLRRFGPVLDGTRYFFLVRARQGGNNLTEFSTPVIFELDLSPDPPTPALNMPPGSLSLDWGLTGAIAACADRVVFRIDKADGSATIQSVESGVSGTKTVDLTAQGPGDYDVRIHARHDGDTAEDAVGRESAPRRATVAPAAAPLVALRVQVGDGVAASCSGSSTTVAGATVRVVKQSPTGDPFDETRTAAKDGRAEFTVPADFSYTVTGSSATCETATAIVRPTADTDLPLKLNCFDPGADVEAALTAPNSVPPGFPIALGVSFRHAGTGGPSRGGRFMVFRTLPDGTAQSQLANQPMAAFCPEETRSLTITDSSPPTGELTYRAIAILPDADQTNNAAERSVTVGLEPLEESAVALSITITSFQLQGGASTVPLSTPITLDAVTSGATPSQYKAAVCGADFTAAPFQPLPAKGPPVLAGFATAGTRDICFQLRSGLTSSATVSDEIQVVAPLARRFEPGDVTQVSGAFTLVTISAFQIRGGAPFVTVGRSVPLNVTATGDPTEFRSIASTSSACETALANQAFRAFSATTPPTVSFGSAGRNFVCFQLRRGAQTSSVAKDDIDVVRGEFPSSGLGNPATVGAVVGRTVTLDCTQLQASSGPWVVGIRVRAGDLIDAMGVRCADLGPNGEHGTVSSPGGEVGGDGGDLQVLDCPSGRVLYGFEGYYGEVIDQVTILCIPWRSDIGSNGAYSPEGTAGRRHIGTSGFGPEVCPGPLAIKKIEPREQFGLVGTFRFVCVAPPGM